MEIGCRTILTVFPAPLRHPEPQFFGGQVERIPNQREGFGSRRQLLSGRSLGQSEEGEGYDSSSERHDEKIDCHSHQRGVWEVRSGNYRDFRAGYIPCPNNNRTVSGD